MKWRSKRISNNVEDRRGMSSSNSFNNNGGFLKIILPLILRLITTKKGLIIVAIGYDCLQKQASGRVMPDSFTHGTSALRMHFNKGFDTGDLKLGDTFNTNSL